MRGNHHNLPRNTQELILYSPSVPFSTPVQLFSLFFQKILLKIEIIRNFVLFLPRPSEKIGSRVFVAKHFFSFSVDGRGAPEDTGRKQKDHRQSRENHHQDSPRDVGEDCADRIRRFCEKPQFVRVGSFEYLVNPYQLDPGGRIQQDPGDVEDIYPEHGGIFFSAVFDRENAEHKRKAKQDNEEDHRFADGARMKTLNSVQDVHDLFPS